MMRVTVGASTIPQHETRRWASGQQSVFPLLAAVLCGVWRVYLDRFGDLAGVVWAAPGRLLIVVPNAAACRWTAVSSGRVGRRLGPAVSSFSGGRRGGSQLARADRGGA